MVKDSEIDKEFEAQLKGKMGWKCSCSLDIIDKEPTLKNVTCKKWEKSLKQTEKQIIALIVKKLFNLNSSHVIIEFLDLFQKNLIKQKLFCLIKEVYLFFCNSSFLGYFLINSWLIEFPCII